MAVSFFRSSHILFSFFGYRLGTDYGTPVNRGLPGAPASGFLSSPSRTAWPVFRSSAYGHRREAAALPEHGHYPAASVSSIMQAIQKKKASGFTKPERFLFSIYFSCANPAPAAFPSAFAVPWDWWVGIFASNLKLFMMTSIVLPSCPTTPSGRLMSWNGWKGSELR